MTAGAAAGVATWTVTYPVDVVKTACQTLPEGTHYKDGTATAVAMRIYRKHGAMAFFRGIGPTVVRAIPSNAVTFLVYEWTMDVLGRPQDDPEPERSALGGVDQGGLRASTRSGYGGDVRGSGGAGSSGSAIVPVSTSQLGMSMTTSPSMQGTGSLANDGRR